MRLIFGLFALLASFSLIVGEETKKHYIIGSHLGAPFLHKNGENFEGFVVDLAEEFSKMVKRSYEIVIPEDGKYGSMDPETHEWNGLIREIIDNKIDLAIADMTITPQRSEAVDFTIPFLTTGVGIFYASSTRQELPFHNVDELVDQDEVKYGVVFHGSTYGFIRDHANTNETFKKMIDYWEEHPEYLAPNSIDGIYRVAAEERKYAFMTEVFALPHWQKKYPSIMKVGDSFKHIDFAVALPKNSSRLERTNEQIRQLQANGVLDALKKKWKLQDD